MTLWCICAYSCVCTWEGMFLLWHMLVIRGKLHLSIFVFHLFLKQGLLFIMALAGLSGPLDAEDSRFHLPFCHRYLDYKSMLSHLALCELWVSKLRTLHLYDACFIHWAVPLFIPREILFFYDESWSRLIYCRLMRFLRLAQHALAFFMVQVDPKGVV